MIKFGILKSKIEKVLLESYSNNTIKDELKKFKTNVLDNKNVSKLFYLYDELNSNKGLSESVVSDYINECTTIYENTVNKIKPNEFQKIKSWVGNVKTKNNYENVDNLFSTDVLTIESRLQSRKVISESLKKNKPLEKEVVNLPLSTMVNVANKTITTFMEGLNETEKKELINLLSEDESKLKDNFDNIKNDVIVKLENLKEHSDESTLIRINETIQKVTSEKYDKLSYFKLKGLKDTL